MLTRITAVLQDGTHRSSTGWLSNHRTCGRTWSSEESAHSFKQQPANSEQGNALRQGLRHSAATGHHRYDVITSCLQDIVCQSGSRGGSTHRLWKVSWGLGDWSSMRRVALLPGHSGPSTVRANSMDTRGTGPEDWYGTSCSLLRRILWCSSGLAVLAPGIPASLFRYTWHIAVDRPGHSSCMEYTFKFPKL